MSDIDKETVEKITADILQAARQSKSETDLQTEVEHILRNFFQKIGVNYEPHHNITIINGRPDTLYGRAVIEYKVPSTLKSKSKQQAAIEEVQRNIEELSEKYHDDKGQYVGIVLDGLEVTFTKYRRGKWITEPVMEVRPETTRRVLEYLHGLARKPLHPDYMVADFGPDNPKSIAKQCVQILCEQLHKTTNVRTKVLYAEWRKTFNQVCGYEFYSQKINLDNLLQEYDIKTNDLTLPEVLFATHTYYAAVIKFLAAEITMAYASPFFKSFLEEIASASKSELKEMLIKLEDGGMFSELGIKNFLEGDFFGWYLDVWNDQIHSFIQLVIRRLLEYEPATAALEPDEVRDLLKNLYQNLIPIDVRRALGEFFTPDWLAELTLDEIGYEGDYRKRLLDPACGSGTFLVLAIKRCREHLLDNPDDKSQALNTILRSVVGFDLNPLAVIASRTNYLIALGDLLRFRRNDIQIPVFLSDSISATGMETLMGRIYEVSTSVGKFSVPSEIIKEGFIDDVFSLADQSIREHYEAKEFIRLLEEKYSDISANASSLLKTLYENLLKLELKGINRIWTRVLKNAFAPNFEGRFDYVVGNPPWTGWESLPEDYRKSTQHLWKEHGLLTKTEGIGLGKIKKDLSMLFLVRSIERYLTETGKLAFLMTFTVFKNQSGAGFRNYLANKCEVVKLHDLVELRPFDAINRTSLIVVDKGRTKFPVAAVSWKKAKSGEIPQNVPLADILQTYGKKQSVVARPVGNSPESPWLIVSPKILKAATNFFGSSTYKAKAGVVTMLNGAYWLRILTKEPGGLLIENLGEISWKKKVKIEQAVVEPDLIYVLLRGQEVKRWSFDPENYILMPNLPNGDDIDDSTMKVQYPKTYSFLNKFFDEFIERAGEPYKTNLEPFKKQGRKARNVEHPFYYIFNANGQFEKYKVVWKHVSGSISGKAEFNAAVVTQIRDKFIGTKPTILDHGLMFVNCSSEQEAHYIAAILNSTVFREVVRGYSLETHVTTDIFDYLRLPEFEKGNRLHLRLAAKSETAHRLTEEGKEKQVQKIEEEIDEIVEQLFE